MLLGLNINDPNELNALKEDIKSYFGGFGKVSALTLSNDTNSQPSVVTIQFEDVASAIIARSYASGLLFYENIIDLEFFPVK